MHQSLTAAMDIANNQDHDVPSSFICPITHKVMIHPVMTRSGLNFERSAILRWLEISTLTNGTASCPVTNKPMKPSDVVPNRKLENLILIWREANHIQLPLANEDQDCQSFQAFGFFVPTDDADKIITKNMDHYHPESTPSVSSSDDNSDGDESIPCPSKKHSKGFLRRILSQRRVRSVNSRPTPLLQ